VKRKEPYITTNIRKQNTGTVKIQTQGGKSYLQEAKGVMARGREKVGKRLEVKGVWYDQTAPKGGGAVFLITPQPPPGG